MELNKKMEELLDAIGENETNQTIEDLKRNEVLINEIAVHCREARIYKDNEERTKEFAKDMDAFDCYKHMLIKVTKAPTSIHVTGVTLMFMPVIADKLKQPTAKEVKELGETLSNQEDKQETADTDGMLKAFKKAKKIGGT